MRRTQLYLDDQRWGALHARAKRENTTISELVRQAVRERYVGSREQRLSAMQRFAGNRKLRVGEPVPDPGLTGVVGGRRDRP